MRRSPGSSRAAGCCSSPSGSMLVAIASFTKPDPRDGLQSWMVDDLRGAVRVACSPSSSASGTRHPRSPTDAPLAGLGHGARLDVPARVRRSGPSTRAPTSSGGRFGAHPVPDPHLAVEDVEGLAGGVVAATVVGGADARPAWARRPLHALALGPLTALAAQAGDLAESMLKRAAGRQGFRAR